MVGRDEWFAIHASGPAETALARSLGRSVSSAGGGGFLVEPEAIPTVITGFEEAIVEMNLAKEAAKEMHFLHGESVNPVADKYMAALLDRATGSEGSVTVAADSAIAAYQDVIDQLDAAMAGYGGDEDTNEATFRKQL